MTPNIKPTTAWVVIPAYNEERCLAQTVADLRKNLPRINILVVDNASTDNTAAVAIALNVLYLLEPRQGKGFAVSIGIEFALKHGAQWIALHDADNEYSAKDLRLLQAECEKAPLDALVMGVGLREVALGRVHWRSLIANLIARIALRLALKATPPLDILTGARVFNAASAKALILDRGQLKGFEMETALTRRAMAIGAHICYAPVRYTPRAVREKKISAWDLLPILKAAFTA